MSDYYVHVNRGTIDSNRKNNRNDPPVRVQKGKSGESQYCHEVELPAGSRVIYSHEGTILSCGARLVIVSPEKPKVIR